MTVRTDRFLTVLAAGAPAATIVWLAAMAAGIAPGATPAAALVLTAAWAVTERRSAAGKPSAAVARTGALILVMLLLIAIPLPGRWTFIYGPLRNTQNLRVADFLEQASRIGFAVSPNARFAFTRNLAGTLRALATAAAALAAGMLAAGMRTGPRRALMRFLIVSGALIGAAGWMALVRIPQGDTLWWIVPVPPSLPGPVACFANRNHFGGLMAILTAPALACLIDDLARRRFVRALAMLSAAAILAVALIATQSRGGLIASLAGLLALAAASGGWRRSGIYPGRRPAYGLAAALAGFLLIGAALWSAPAGVRERLGEITRRPLTAPSAQTRIEAWRDTLRVWRRYPWFGAGPYALRMVFPQHRISAHREFRTHASNQYLQLPAENGVAGAIMAAIFFGAVIRALAAGRRALSESDGLAGRTRAGNRLLFAGACGAFAAGAAHALMDFPQHVPLYAVYMAILTGLGFPPPDSGMKPPAPPGRILRPPFIALAIAALILPAWRQMQRRDNPLSLQSAGFPELAQSLAWAPTSWQAWYEFGRRGCSAGHWEGVVLGEQAISQAAALDPNNYRLWYELGRLRLGMGDRDGARKAFARVRELRDWVRLPAVAP